VDCRPSPIPWRSARSRRNRTLFAGRVRGTNNSWVGGMSSRADSGTSRRTRMPDKGRALSGSLHKEKNFRQM
jgi:hypothetical protein